MNIFQTCLFKPQSIIKISHLIRFTTVQVQWVFYFFITVCKYFNMLYIIKNKISLQVLKTYMPLIHDQEGDWESLFINDVVSEVSGVVDLWLSGVSSICTVGLEMVRGWAEPWSWVCIIRGRDTVNKTPHHVKMRSHQFT